MKISIEYTDQGELLIESMDGQEIEAIMVNALLDIAKLNLVTSLMRVEEESTATPEDADEIPV